MVMEKGITLLNVSKRFGEIWAVKNVNAIIFPRKITAFVGPNGAGKTTLFHLVSGGLKPDTGKIFYNGTEISGLPPWKVARMGIGRQFQDVRVFMNLSCLENVVAALISERESYLIHSLVSFIKKGGIKRYVEEAKYWLLFVGLLEYADTLAENLSFGQQKLLSIARLLAGKFDVLLLDEPTSGVALHMVKKILDLIQKMVSEERKTVAIIEHDMGVIKEVAYWVHFFHEGSLTFTGRTDHVLGHPKVRELYMGI